MAKITKEQGDLYYYVQQIDILRKEDKISIEEEKRLLEMFFSIDQESMVMAKEIINNLVTGAAGTTKP